MDIKIINLNPLFLSLYIAFFSASLLFLISFPLAWWFSRNKTLIKSFIEIIIFLPLVLPSTVLGFYILFFFNSNTFFGKLWYYIFGSNLMFSTSGLIFASMIYSLPFSVQPIQVVLRKINKDMIDQAYLLKFSNFDIFFKIILPFCKNGLLKSFFLTFAHVLGEFGIVLMIGGNIPGKTKVISIAIYEAIETLNYNLANKLCLIVLSLMFLIMFIIFLLNKDEN